MKKIVLKGVAFILVMVVGNACALLEDENVGKGRKYYNSYCASCHGEKGLGDGFNAVNVEPEPRNLADSKEVYVGKQTNEDLFKVISSGGVSIKKSPRMPPYGHTLSEKQIWQIIAFVRTLHSYSGESIDFTKEMSEEHPKTPLKKIDAAKFKKKNKRAVKMGKKLYKKTGCSACHKIKDKGGVIGPDLTHIGSRLNANWTYTFLLSPQRVIKHVKMPNYGLKDKVAFFMAHYLKSLK